MTNFTWVCTELTPIDLPLSVKLYNYTLPFQQYFIIQSPTILSIKEYIDCFLNYELVNISFLKNIELPTYIISGIKFNVAYAHVYTNFVYVLVLFMVLTPLCYALTQNSRVEKELNSIDDLFYFLGLFFFLIFFILGFYIFNTTMLVYTVYFMYIFLSILVGTVVLIPIVLLINYGFYFVYYLRGSDITTYLVYEVFLDYINLISFFLRIFIQFIRICLICLTIYTYNEFFYEFNNSLLFSINAINNGSINVILLSIIHYIVEYIHVLLIFIAQLITFVGMLLWLVQFLFTTFNLARQESFFINLRTL